MNNTALETFSTDNFPGFSGLAPRPCTLAKTGLSRNYLDELVVKHLYDAGILELNALAKRTALSGPILEDILNGLRQNAYTEIRGTAGTTASLRYALTDRGRLFAEQALKKSGYLGRASVPLEQYVRILKKQSIHNLQVTREKMTHAFSGVVISDELSARLGPAIHSGRPIFIYGPPGTGKSYLSTKITHLMDDPVLIPESIAIGDMPVEVFDPIVHKPAVSETAAPDVRLEKGHDPRFILCERPSVVVGGELTLDMLEIQYEASTRRYQAPVQLKANNGVFVIDDLGRQRCAPVDLFNRWIVPMETKHDHFNLASGQRFTVPFDVILIFSTNLNPADLADEAFLRRIGHKIHFGYLTPEQYTQIWIQVCRQQEVSFDPILLRYVLDELHGKRNVPLLPCHPRDLLGMALDLARFWRGSKDLDTEMLESAWESYFVRMNRTPDDLQMQPGDV